MDFSASDVIRDLRGLLAAGRFRDVLVRHATGGSTAPEAALVAATAATRLGELPEATSLAEAAMTRFRTRADQDGLLRTLNLMGAIGFERGDLESASDRFERALEVARSLGDRLMTARALNNAASVQHLRDDAETALSRYREALLVYQSLGDRRGAAETYHNLGLVYREAGEIAEAERMAEHAVRHATLARMPGLLSLALTGRAEIALARADAALAEEALDRADALAAEAEDAPGQAEILRVRSLVALSRGQLQLALDWSRLARERARELGSLLLEAESAVVAARALTRLSRTEEAGVMRSAAAELFRRLGAAAHLSRLEAED